MLEWGVKGVGCSAGFLHGGVQISVGFGRIQTQVCSVVLKGLQTSPFPYSETGPPSKKEEF